MWGGYAPWVSPLICHQKKKKNSSGNWILLHNQLTVKIFIWVSSKTRVKDCTPTTLHSRNYTQTLQMGEWRKENKREKAYLYHLDTDWRRFIFLYPGNKSGTLCLLKSCLRPSLHFVRATTQLCFNSAVWRLNQFCLKCLNFSFFFPRAQNWFVTVHCALFYLHARVAKYLHKKPAVWKVLNRFWRRSRLTGSDQMKAWRTGGSVCVWVCVCMRVCARVCVLVAREDTAGCCWVAEL